MQPGKSQYRGGWKGKGVGEARQQWSLQRLLNEFKWQKGTWRELATKTRPKGQPELKLSDEARRACASNRPCQRERLCARRGNLDCHALYELTSLRFKSGGARTELQGRFVGRTWLGYRITT